ncbi:MAG: hypothetical protein NVSMB32_00450 [Actinomycetota bacterium]
MNVVTGLGEEAGAALAAHPGIDFADFLIAATAEVAGMELVTLNIKHFPMLKRLQSPY